MEKLRNWIGRHGTLKKFLEEVGISRSFLSEWENGKKGFSLQMASKIVRYTNREITFEDLVNFENSFK